MKRGPTTPTGRGLFCECDPDPDPCESMLLYASTVVAIEDEAKAQERERLVRVVAAVPATDSQDYEKDGHHYIIHGGMWWPQDVMDALCPESAE